MKFFTVFLLLLNLSNHLYALDCRIIRSQYQCPGNENYPVHLSFDDGPADVTPGLLDLLRREKIPATFFVLAERIDCNRHDAACQAGDATACTSLQYCQQHRNTLKRILYEGHTLGSHSYSHLHLSALPSVQLHKQINRSKQLLSPFLNTTPPVFRLPFGDGWFNRKQKPAVLEALKKAGFKHIAWEMSAFDWRQADQHGDTILHTVMHEICTKKEGVILFHDGDFEQEHRGRTFTAEHFAEWVPVIRCIADFKPLNYFYPDIIRH